MCAHTYAPVPVHVRAVVKEFNTWWLQWEPANRGGVCVCVCVCLLRSWAAANNVEETRDGLWRAFINRVRDHLHMVLAMSPVGEAFRAR